MVGHQASSGGFEQALRTTDVLSPTRHPELSEICEGAIYRGKPTKKQN